MSKIPDIVKQSLAIILVPGSFTPPSFYKYVTATLRDHGFSEVQEYRLLSACPADDQPMPPARLEDDTAYIKEALEKQISNGKDVMIVANSYGGFPATQALQGLKSSRNLSGEGEPGAIVGIVYLSSFLPFPGDSLRSVMGDALFEPLKSGNPGNYMYLPGESGPGIFSDWASEGRDEDVNHWFGEMVTHSSDSFDGKVSYDMWSDKSYGCKVVYIIGEKDVVVPPSLAESMIEKVESVSGKGKVEVVRVESGGHVMHLTKPDEVVKVVESVIERLL